MKLSFELADMKFGMSRGAPDTWPTMHSILETGLDHGQSPMIYDEDGDRLADAAGDFLMEIRRSPTLVLTEERRDLLVKIIKGVGEYADMNNYGSPGEDIEDDRLFGMLWARVEVQLHPEVLIGGPQSEWPQYGVTVLEA
jgi:hypothetical protein